MRIVSYLLREEIDQECNHLLLEGDIEPVKSMKWAGPIVPVINTNDSFRVHGNFKVTANHANADQDVYPLNRTMTSYNSV